MRKSASLLGRELGKTGRQMNELLREYGYLKGEPNAYSLTDKGKKYGVERDEHRGVGGYSHYNRAWTVRTWEEEVLDALVEEMKNRHVVPQLEDDSTGEYIRAIQDEEASDRPRNEIDNEYQDVARLAAWLTVGAVTLAVGIRVVPHAKRWWSNSATPGMKKAWRKIAGDETADDVRKGDDIRERTAETAEPDSGGVEA